MHLHHLSAKQGQLNAFVLGKDRVDVEGPLNSVLRLSASCTYSNWHEHVNRRENAAYTEMLLTAKRAAAEAVRLRLVESVAVPALVAEQFLHVLGETIGRETLHVVRMRNMAEPDSDVCHSHDFCDANMVMVEAMASLGVDALPEDSDGMPDEVVDLWNRSWDLAKESLQLRGAIPRD